MDLLKKLRRSLPPPTPHHLETLACSSSSSLQSAKEWRRKCNLDTAHTTGTALTAIQEWGRYLPEQVHQSRSGYILSASSSWREKPFWFFLLERHLPRQSHHLQPPLLQGLGIWLHIKQKEKRKDTGQRDEWKHLINLIFPHNHKLTYIQLNPCHEESPTIFLRWHTFFVYKLVYFFHFLQIWSCPCKLYTCHSPETDTPAKQKVCTYKTSW